MAEHIVVTKEEWTAARIRLLAREKELTRLRDDVSQERRDLPWVKVDKQYVFDGPNGKETLSENHAGNCFPMMRSAPDQAQPSPAVSRIDERPRAG